MKTEETQIPSTLDFSPDAEIANGERGTYYVYKTRAGARLVVVPSTGDRYAEAHTSDLAEAFAVARRYEAGEVGYCDACGTLELVDGVWVAAADPTIRSEDFHCGDCLAGDQG